MTFIENLNVPFKYPLFESGFHSDYEKSLIQRIKNRPHKVVRIESGFYDTHSFDELHGQIQSTQYEYLENARILQKLQEQYNVPVPDFDIVIGSGEGQQVTYYTVVDRIYGADLEYHAIKPREEKRLEKLVDALYSSIGQYFWDVYREGGWYLTDLVRDNSQFVYGRKNGERGKRIYFVDVEPRLEYLNPEDPRTHLDLFNFTFNWLWELTKGMEVQLGSKLRLTRCKLLDFANTISPAHEYYSFIQTTKEEIEHTGLIESGLKPPT